MAVEDGTIGYCKTCGHQIVFELDDPTADDSPYGLWYAIDTGIESCTPGPYNEDRYHEPEEE